MINAKVLDKDGLKSVISKEDLRSMIEFIISELKEGKRCNEIIVFCYKVDWDRLNEIARECCIESNGNYKYMADSSEYMIVYRLNALQVLELVKDEL